MNGGLQVRERRINAMVRYRIDCWRYGILALTTGTIQRA